MTKESLIQILKTEKLGTGDTLTVPEDREATVLIGSPGETIQVAKIVRIELFDTSLCLATSKDEHFWFTYDLVLGLRLLPAKVAKDRAAGFTRAS